jgi:hypothetical protein
MEHDMSIIITNTQGQAVQAKDVSSSKHTRNQIDNTIAYAKQSRTRKAFAYIDMADHTQQTIIITIR